MYLYEINYRYRIYLLFYNLYIVNNGNIINSFIIFESIDRIQEIHQMTLIKNRPFLCSKLILTSKLKILPTISGMNKNVDIHLLSILSQNIIL